MKLDNRLWVLITAILCVVALAGGWFLGVEPQLSAAAAATASRAEIDDQNATTRDEISQLREANEGLATLQDQLGSIRRLLPPGVSGSPFIASLERTAVASAVQLKSFTIGDPIPYTPPQGAESPAADAAAEASETGAEAEAPPVPEPTGPLPATDPLVTGENLVLVPISIEVQGPNAQVLQFLQSVQQGERLIAVNSVKSTRNDGADGAVVDDFTLTLGGYLFVLRDTASEAAAEG